MAFFLFFSVLLLSSLSEALGLEELKLEFIDEIQLNSSHDQAYKTSLSKFDATDSVLLFASENPVSVSLYDLNSGDQLFYKEMSGQGPFEISVPWDIYISDEHIYVLDIDGKIVILSIDGQGLKEHRYSVVNPWRIAPAENKIFVTTNSPGMEYYILAFDPENGHKQNFGPQQSFGNAVMSGIPESGPLVVHEGLIYVIPSYGKSLSLIDPQNLEIIASYELDIEGFEHEILDKNIEVALRDPARRRGFINNNSVITGLHPMPEGWIVEVLFWEEYRRELVVFDDNFTPVCQGKIPDMLHGLDDPKIHFSDGRFLYVYREEIEGNDYRKIISKYRLSCL